MTRPALTAARLWHASLPLLACPRQQGVCRGRDWLSRVFTSKSRSVCGQACKLWTCFISLNERYGSPYFALISQAGGLRGIARPTHARRMFLACIVPMKSARLGQRGANSGAAGNSKGAGASAQDPPTKQRKSLSPDLGPLLSSTRTRLCARTHFFVFLQCSTPTALLLATNEYEPLLTPVYVHVKNLCLLYTGIRQ